MGASHICLLLSLTLSLMVSSRSYSKRANAIRPYNNNIIVPMVGAHRVRPKAQAPNAQNVI